MLHSEIAALAVTSAGVSFMCGVLLMSFFKYGDCVPQGKEAGSVLPALACCMSECSTGTGRGECS